MFEWNWNELKLNETKLKNYNIIYDYIDYENRIIHNENHNFIDIEKYKNEFNSIEKCTDE